MGFDDGRCSKIFCRVLHLSYSLHSANNLNKSNSKTIQTLYDENTRQIMLLHLPRGAGNKNRKLMWSTFKGLIDISTYS